MSGMMTVADTLSRGNLWDPSHLDLELWLDGTDPTTMDIDASGIAVWRDKSVNGRNVTRSGGTPEFRSRTFRPGGVVSLKHGDTLSAVSGLFALPRVTCYIASFVEPGPDADPQQIGHGVPARSNIVGVTRGSREWRWSFGHRNFFNGFGTPSDGANINYFINNQQHFAPSGNTTLDVNAVCITTISTEYAKIWRNVFFTSNQGAFHAAPDGLLRAPNPTELFLPQHIPYISPFWLQIGDENFSGSVGEIIVMSGTVGEYDPVRAKIEGYLAHKFSQNANYGPNHSFHNFTHSPPFRVWSPADIDVRKQGFWYDANDAVTEVVSEDPDYFINASGGTMSEIDVNGVPYILHEFTSNGTFSVNFAGPQAKVEYLLVGGGGASGMGEDQGRPSSGGGAGGLLTNLGTQSPHPITRQDYSIMVGAPGGHHMWGQPGSSQSVGGVSVFDTFVALGGGTGGSLRMSGSTSAAGSGGGGWVNSGPYGNPGSPGFLGTPGQGHNGGAVPPDAPNGPYGGGGGAGGPGTTSDAGPGLLLNFTGTDEWYAVGGAGAPSGNVAPGGAGPGIGSSPTTFGSGGGGMTSGGNNHPGNLGRQGVVYIRYPKINGFTGVRSIIDRSAYARHLTQTNPDNYPLIVGNALNRQQVVRASGNQWLEMDNVAEVLQNEDFVDIYFIANPTETSSNNTLFNISTPDPNDTRLSFEFGSDTNPDLPSATARRLDSDAPIGVQDDNFDDEFDLYHIKISYNASSGIELYKNSVLIDSQPFDSLGATENTPSTIGRLFSETSKLDFAEIVCLKQDGFSEFVEGYLANKWGINHKLPASHKFRITEPTFDDIGNPSQFVPFDATGGMITEYTENGRKWRAHTFTDTIAMGNPFVVTQLGHPNFMRVFIGSGGGAGGGSHLSQSPGGGGGAGGGLSHWQQPFEVKEYTVYVGAGAVGPRGDEAPAGGGVSYIDGLTDLYRVGAPTRMLVEGGGGGACVNGSSTPMSSGGVSPGGYAANLGNVGHNTRPAGHPGGFAIPHYTSFRLGNEPGWPQDNTNPNGVVLYSGIATGGGGFGGGGEATGSGAGGAIQWGPPVRSSSGGWWTGIQPWNGIHGAFGFGGNGGAGNAGQMAPKRGKHQAGGGVASDGEPGMNIYGNAGGGAGNNPGASLVGGAGGSGMVIIAYPLEEPLS